MELWTAEHAMTLPPAVVAMIIIALILRKVLKKDEKIRMLPIQILSCLLLVMEVGKQVLSLVEGYDLYCLPFHYCSLFLYVMPVMSFYRGKHRNAVFAVSTALCASVFLLMMIYPALIYSADNVLNFFNGYFDFHTVAFHNIVVFLFILIIALDIHPPMTKGSSKPIIIFVLCFCVVAASMAHLLKTNFANYYTCNIPVLEEVRLAVQNAIGTLPATLMYISILSALNVGFTLMSYQLYRFIHFVINRKSKAAIQ